MYFNRASLGSDETERCFNLSDFPFLEFTQNNLDEFFRVYYGNTP